MKNRIIGKTKCNRKGEVLVVSLVEEFNEMGEEDKSNYSYMDEESTRRALFIHRRIFFMLDEEFDKLIDVL